MSDMVLSASVLTETTVSPLASLRGWAFVGPHKGPPWIYPCLHYRISPDITLGTKPYRPGGLSVTHNVCIVKPARTPYSSIRSTNGGVCAEIPQRDSVSLLRTPESGRNFYRARSSAGELSEP